MELDGAREKHPAEHREVAVPVSMSIIGWSLDWLDIVTGRNFIPSMMPTKWCAFNWHRRPWWAVLR